MPISSRQESGASVIEADGDLGAEQAVELLEGLRVAIDGKKGSVLLDLSGVTDLDLTCLQLICSAHKSAEKRGKTLEIISASDEFIHIASEAGMIQQNDCSSDLGDSCPLRFMDSREMK